MEQVYEMGKTYIVQKSMKKKALYFGDSEV